MSPSVWRYSVILLSKFEVCFKKLLHEIIVSNSSLGNKIASLADGLGIYLSQSYVSLEKGMITWSF